MPEARMLSMTQEEYDRLADHVKDLKQQLDDALEAMGTGAEADSNTWHDNPAFDEATTKVDMATRRLGVAQSRLNRAVVVVSPSSGNEVGIGSTVTILYAGDDEPETVHIGGDHVVNGLSRGDGAEVISSSSLMGQALMGKTKGETVTFTGPTGTTLSVTIIELS